MENKDMSKVSEVIQRSSEARELCEVNNEKFRELLNETFEFLYNKIDSLDISQNAKTIYFYSIAKALYYVSDKAMKWDGKDGN